ENAARVLRGERGDRRGAIDAERGKGLQVGLDAGAAAGIRSGDGERDRHGHAAPRFCKALSTMARSLAAACPGSGAKDKAEITAMPSAPAAITSAALVSAIPAIAQMGNPGARPRTAAAMDFSPSRPMGGSGLSLETVAKTPPMAT